MQKLKKALKIILFAQQDVSLYGKIVNLLQWYQG